MNHKWAKHEAYGSGNGYGRPAGVTTKRECVRCGAQRGVEPVNDERGRVVYRQWYRLPDGDYVARDEFVGCVSEISL